MGKPEKKIEDRLTAGVKRLGGKAYKLVSPGCAGMPDRLVCLPGGITVFCELKSPKGTLSKLQIERIRELDRTGHRIYVLRDTGGVDAFLDLMKEEISSEVQTL